MSSLAAQPERVLFGRWLGGLLAGARWSRDLDRAEWFLAGCREAAPGSAAFDFAEGHLATARGRESKARARLQSGLQKSRENARATVALARLLYQDQPERALELADGAATSAPTAWAPHEVRMLALRRLGLVEPALQALLAAAQRAPPAGVFERGVRFARAVDRPRLAKTLVRQLDVVEPRGQSARAARRAVRSGRIDDGIAAYREAATVERAAERLTRVAELELGRRAPNAALRASLEAVRAAPDHGPAWRARLKAALLLRDPLEATRALEKLRTLEESSLEQERLLGPVEATPGALAGLLAYDPWRGVRAAGENALPPGLDPTDRWAQHDRVVLLDRLVDHVLPGGRALTWHHEIARLQSKDAIDRAGEIEVPPDAILLQARTLKPDGRSIDVDRHDGKADISFSALARGDAVEQRWMRLEPPASPFGGYARRFYFQSQEPLLRSEFTVVVPRGQRLHYKAYHGAPAPRLVELPHRRAYIFRADDVPASDPEPMMSHRDLFIPHVVVWTQLDEQDALRTDVAGLRAGARGTLVIDDLARTLTATIAAPESKLRRLFGWVVENIDRGARAPPEEIVSRARGSRNGLLVALARAAGVPAELTLIRTGLQPHIGDGTPRIGGFRQRIVRAEPQAGDVVWLDLDGKGPWMGGLPPHYEGGQILRATPRGPSVERIPDTSVGRWSGACALVLDVDAAGTARGQLSLKVPTGQAGGTRQFLLSARPELVERKLQALLSRLVRGGRLTGHRVRALHDPIQDLTLELELTAPHFATLEGEGVILEDLPERPVIGRALGRPGLEDFVAKATRETPLQLHPTVEHMVVQLTFERAGLLPEVLPTDFTEEVSFGRFSRRVRYEPAARRLTLTLTYETRMDRVQPEDYREFAGSARELLQRLRNRVVLGPPRAGASARDN